MTRLSDAELRRQGRADAAVLLVAHRVCPTVELTEWGDHLGLTQRDLIDAVDRWKAAQYAAAGIRQPGTEPKARAKPKPHPVLNLACPDGCTGQLFADRRALAAHIRCVHQTAVCPDCGGVFKAGGLGPHRAARHRVAS